MSEVSPDFNNRNESMMMMFKGDNDSMERVIDYRRFNKDLVTASGKKVRFDRLCLFYYFRSHRERMIINHRTHTHRIFL